MVSGGGGELPDVPFAEDLLFYAPLTQGDLTDHISGVSPIQDANTTITWDSSKQMYLLNSKPGRSSYYVSPLRYVGVSVINVHQSPLTLFAQVVCSKNGNNYCAMVITPDWRTAGKGKSIYYMGETRFGGKDTSLRKYCGVWNGSGNVKFYKNGSQTNSISWGSSTKWTGSSCVAICMANDCSEYEIYAKDVRIYGRALSAAEVAQL